MLLSKKISVISKPNKSIIITFVNNETGDKFISSQDLTAMSKDNKFQHKWLFYAKYAYCEKTKTWSLVSTGGEDIFCSLSRIFDTKQHNGFKSWNNTANIRCRPDTVEEHFKSEIHKDAYEASQRRENSSFDREVEKKAMMLNNEVYLKVFKVLYWLVKEEIVSTKTTSLLELIEKMVVDDLKADCWVG